MAYFELKHITPTEAYANLKEDKTIIVLDVREQDEFKERHIKGATHIPLGKVAYEILDKVEAMDTPLYVYCRSGVRSIRACQILHELGYTNMYDLGGINNWPYEVVKP